jgi:hypothetical protein
MRGGNPRHHVGFHIDRGCTGRSVKLAFLGRLGDRRIDADDWSVDGACDHAEELARPHRIRRADGFRFANSGSDYPIASAQVGGEAAGNAEADHAAVTLPDGAVGDRRQLASGRAADDQDAGTRGDASLEVQTHECNDEATRVFDSSLGKPTRVVTLIHQSIYESTAGEIQLGCH